MLQALLQYVVAQPRAQLQLRAGRVPSLVENKQTRELPVPAVTQEELLQTMQEVLQQEFDTETPQTISGTVVFADLGSFEFRARTDVAALAMAVRLIPPPSEVTSKPHLTDPSQLRTDSIHELLEDVVRLRASDLVVTSSSPASVRHGSEFRQIDGATYTAEEILGSLGATLTAERKKTLEDEGNCDVAYELSLEGQEKKQRFRVNVFHHMNGLAAAFRPIWDEIPSFEDLNLPDSMRDLAEYPHGLVLLTGPTGAGKSTTLCSLLERVNHRRHCHIITLEDPIEFVFTRQKALIHQREVGVHVSSFAGGLRAALRENPDIILVGEMRDKETISAAITAAETGHLVLSTLHCGTAAQAIDRMIDIFPEHQQTQIRVQLADVLQAIVTQRLLPMMGKKDRIPATEILRVNLAVANMIRDSKTHLLTSQMQTSRGEGMLPFDDSIVALFKAGRISAETAVKAAAEPKTIRNKIGLESG